MPTPPQEQPYVGNAAALVTPQMLERWRDIVSRAVAQGADITQLVQHFAERAFENKALGLEPQGTRRRALTNLRGVLLREEERAQKVIDEAIARKEEKLRRPFSSVKIEFAPPQQTLAQDASKRARRTGEPPLSNISDKHAYTVVPVQPPLTLRAQLGPYMAELQQQRAKIEDEGQKLDELLNRGMVGQARTVADLGAASRELYRIAREIEQAFVAQKNAAAPAGAAAPQALDDEATAAMPRAPTPLDDDATQTYVAEPGAQKAPDKGALGLLRRLTERPKGR